MAERYAAAAGGAVLVWGTNALAAGAALEHLTVEQVLALQFGAATAALLAARAAGRARRSAAAGSRRRLGARGVALGVVGLTGTIALQYVAFATAPLIAANAITYAWPLIVAAVVALRRPAGRRSRASLGAAVVGFAGVVLIFSQRPAGGDELSAPLLGYLAAVGSALAMAWYTLAAGRAPGSRSDLLLVATSTGAAITIPLALFQHAAWSPPAAIALGLYTGLGPMAAGYALWTYAMSHPAGARLAPIAYATPLLSTAVLLAGGERLTPLGLVGCALIVVCAAGILLDRSPNEPAPTSERPATTNSTGPPTTERAIGGLRL